MGSSRFLLFQTVAEAFVNVNPLVKFAFAEIAKKYGEGLYKPYKMHELIWGYHDPMMTMAKKLLPGWFYTDFLGIWAGVGDVCGNNSLE